MADYELPDGRYTNKDFQAIYEEMLEYARKLSLKWDPSQSNESDPGVVLIKELALFADKNNYNSDKNLLEAFPSTVTQMGNARKLFEQLGYTMKWYQSGTSEISMRWIGEGDVPTEIKIPKFTMVSNNDDSAVFTIIDDKSLSVTGNTLFNVVEGTAVDYTVAGSKRITADHLDADNRLYFTENNIAENGIFICNVDDYDEPVSNYDEWSIVDNLSVEPYAYGDTYNRIFKFGVLSDGNTCYIEFPENASSIINYGINITYILSNGQNGNIEANALSKFYNDIVIKDNNGVDVVLSQDNVLISNYSAIGNGYEPESIDDAYRNYKKTIGTFNTLVSLRDYMNAINTSGLVSNGFVTDRTNDIQSSYHIISTDSGVTRRVLKIVEHDLVPEMNAFNLKMYLLDLVDSDTISNIADYDKTFNVVRNVETTTLDTKYYIVDEEIYNVLNYIDKTKSIQHDFISHKVDDVCMIINKYPINCTIIPKQRITKVQAAEIESDIISNLCDKLNSKKVEFGVPVEYDDVYDVIVNSNGLIKSAILEDLTYQAFAVYYDENNISLDGSAQPGYVARLISGDMSNNQYYGTWNSDTSTYDSPQKDSWSVGDKCLDIADGKVYTKTDSSWEFDKTTTIQDDIYAKSVLNGNTQLFVHDEDFDYTYTQKPQPVGSDNSPIIDGVDELSTQAAIVLNISNGTGQYTLKNNENIILQSPNMITKESYTIGVRYQYRIGDNIPSNANYRLKDNESICFYWTEEDSDTADYRYAFYGKGTIISPTFDMMRSNSATGSNDVYAIGAVPYIPAAMNIVNNGSSSGYIIGGSIRDSYSGEIYTYKEFIKNKLASSVNNLSSTKYVEIKDMNQKTFSYESDGYYRECYWILNNRVYDDASGKYKYQLFGDTGEFEQSYTLNSNEYFMYTNADHSEFEILGPDTKIVRRKTIGDSTLTAWSCDVIDSSYQTILSEGVKSLSKYWQSIQSNCSIELTESVIYTLGEGATLHVSAYEWAQDCVWKADNIPIDATLVDVSDFIILGKKDDDGFKKWESGDNYSDIQLYDLNHIYFDRETGKFYIAAASSTGLLLLMKDVTNYYAQLTVIKTVNDVVYKIPYSTYLAGNGDIANTIDFKSFDLPRSDKWQASVIYASSSDNGYSVVVDKQAIALVGVYEVSESGDSGTISPTTLDKYIDLTNTSIPVGDYSVLIQNASTEQVKEYLTKEMPANSISSTVYYWVDNENVEIWGPMLCNKLNDVTLLFYNDGCAIQSNDGNFDSLSEFAMWYNYENDVVKIPPSLLSDSSSGWEGRSTLNINMTNSSPQTLFDGQSIIATRVKEDETIESIPIASAYQWQKVSASASELLAHIFGFSVIVENSDIKYFDSDNGRWETLSEGTVSVKSVTGSVVHITKEDININSESADVDSYYAQLSVDSDGSLVVDKCYKSVVVDGEEVSLLSNKDLIVDGPVATVSEQGLLGSVEYPSLFVYQYNIEKDDASGDYDITYNNDGSIGINIVSQHGNPAYVQFNVFEGKYIIPVDVPLFGAAFASIGCDFKKAVGEEQPTAFPVFDLTSGKVVTINTVITGKHYYLLDVDSPTTLRLNIQAYGSEFSKYDVNGDGRITNADAQYLLNVAAHSIQVDEQFVQDHDLDGDGEITATDALKVARVVAGLDLIGGAGISQVIIGNIYRYTNPTLPTTYESILNEYDDVDDVIMNDTTLNTIAMNVVRLNGVDGVFDFTYQVDPDDEIENPLDANSFFNKKHIYNPFTIGKMKTISDDGKKSLIKIKVTQVSR